MEAAAKKNAVICHKKEGIDGLFEDGREMIFCEDYNNFKTRLNGLIEEPVTGKEVANAAYVWMQHCCWEGAACLYVNIHQSSIN